MSKTKEFIKKARAKHGDRYDYSKTAYVRARDKVIINCLEHGEFEQTASGHLKGNGCAKCSLNRPLRVSFEEFIRRARDRHGNLYDYSMVVYAGMKTRVNIMCTIHGQFEQTPHHHVQGSGCQRCAQQESGGAGWSTGMFVKRASAAHGGRYNYSKTRYLKGTSKVTITCPAHGDFYLEARAHLRGIGCQSCKIEERTSMFIRKAKEKHGDTYSYSRAMYAGWNAPVIITCRVHGDFEQRADRHWSGKGCIKCSATAALTTGEFIEKAVQVHGDKYDYSKSKYKNSNCKITIICSEHGEFEQRATNHLMGKGCSLCPSSYRYDEPTSVYLMTNGRQVKIGYSIEPDARLAGLNKVQPFTAKLLLSWVLPNMPTARSAETDIHKELADCHAGLAGFEGATEWFNTTPMHAAAVVANIVKQYQ